MVSQRQRHSSTFFSRKKRCARRMNKSRKRSNGTRRSRAFGGMELTVHKAMLKLGTSEPLMAFLANKKTRTIENPKLRQFFVYKSLNVPREMSIGWTMPVMTSNTTIMEPNQMYPMKKSKNPSLIRSVKSSEEWITIGTETDSRFSTHTMYLKDFQPEDAKQRLLRYFQEVTSENVIHGSPIADSDDAANFPIYLSTVIRERSKADLTREDQSGLKSIIEQGRAYVARKGSQSKILKIADSLAPENKIESEEMVRLKTIFNGQRRLKYLLRSPHTQSRVTELNKFQFHDEYPPSSAVSESDFKTEIINDLQAILNDQAGCTCIVMAFHQYTAQRFLCEFADGYTEEYGQINEKSYPRLGNCALLVINSTHIRVAYPGNDTGPVVDKGKEWTLNEGHLRTLLESHPDSSILAVRHGQALHNGICKKYKKHNPKQLHNSVLTPLGIKQAFDSKTHYTALDIDFKKTVLYSSILTRAMLTGMICARVCTLMHHNVSDEQLEQYFPTVFKNLIHSAKSLEHAQVSINGSNNVVQVTQPIVEESSVCIAPDNLLSEVLSYTIDRFPTEITYECPYKVKYIQKGH